MSETPPSKRHSINDQAGPPSTRSRIVTGLRTKRKRTGNSHAEVPWSSPRGKAGCKSRASAVNSSKSPSLSAPDDVSDIDAFAKKHGWHGPVMSVSHLIYKCRLLIWLHKISYLTFIVFNYKREFELTGSVVPPTPEGLDTRQWKHKLLPYTFTQSKNSGNKTWYTGVFQK